MVGGWGVGVAYMRVGPCGGRGSGLWGMHCKGLHARLELGNVVTGEGEREESGSWRLDEYSVGRRNRRVL
jgi:hypothetical protein